MQISSGKIQTIISVTESKAGGAPGSARQSNINTSDVFSITNGTGANQVNEFYDDTRTMVAGTAQIADPTLPPTLTNAAATGGTIPGGATYSVRYAYQNASGFLASETLPSPAATIAVPAGTNTNTIGVTIPGGALPAGATGAVIFISTLANQGFEQTVTTFTGTVTGTVTGLAGSTALLPQIQNTTITPAVDTLDLTAGTIKDSFGDGLVAKAVKELYIHNNSLTGWMAMGGTGQTFGGPLSIASALRMIGPGQEYHWTYYGASGYPVLSGLNNVIKILNFDVSPLTYALVVAAIV